MSLRTLPIGRARDDGLEHGFHVPAALLKLDRQPIEQLRMRRRFTLRAEILRCLHQPGTEEHLPEAIDSHARRERVFGADKPARESKPVVRPGFRHRRQHRGNAALDSLAWSVIGAALQHITPAAAPAVPASPSPWCTAASSAALLALQLAQSSSRPAARSSGAASLEKCVPDLQPLRLGSHLRMGSRRFGKANRDRPGSRICSALGKLCRSELRPSSL